MSDRQQQRCHRLRLGRSASLCIGLAVLGAVFLVPRSAHAATPIAYDIDVEVLPSRTAADPVRLVGTLDLRFDAGASERELRMWLLPDRLALSPSYLDERTGRWVYPGEIELGGIRVASVRIDGRAASSRTDAEAPGTTRGRDFAGATLVVEFDPRGGQRTLSLRFEVDLPSRFGRLGHQGMRWSLTAPWYPLLLDGDVFRFRVPHRLTVRMPTNIDVRAAGQPLRSGATRVFEGAYVPLVAAPRWHERRFEVLGTSVRVLSSTPLAPSPDPDARGEFRLRDLSEVDVVGLLRAAISDCFRTMRALGVALPARPIEIVLVPSRTELAANAPGWVLLSDRIYQIFPIREARLFHDRAVKRALFRYLIADAVDEAEPPADRSWSEDLRAATLVELDEHRRDGRILTAEDVVGWAGFHPMIDKLLYAPQITFVDAFFGLVEEPDPYRDAPERARFPFARGRRLLEHARDRLPTKTFATTVLALLRRPSEPARVLFTRYGAQAVLQHLDRWLLEVPLEVNYRLGAVTTERVGAEYEHRIAIHRDGDIRWEPVEVSVIDAAGNERTAVWDAPDRQGVVTIRTPAPRAVVTVDPRGRLPQSTKVASGHPRGDDSDAHPLRPPVFDGIALSYGATERVVIALADFVIRRRYRLDGGIRVRVESNARSYGGLVGYVFDFGLKRDDNDRIGYVVPNLGIDRLRSRFALDGVGGMRLSALVTAGYNTRVYYRDPRGGSSFNVHLRGSGIRRDDGSLSASLSASARGNVTLPVGLKGALVLVAGADWVFGDALPSELPGLGGQFYLRGYETDEVLGRGRLFGVVEQRITVLSDLAWNFAHVAWVREVQLVGFVGAGLVYRATDGRRWVPGADAGLGLRFHFEYGGVQPGLVAIDAAIPFLRDVKDRGRPPVSLYLSFDQFF